MTTYENLILLSLLAGLGVGAAGAEEPASSENTQQASQITQPEMLDTGATLGGPTSIETLVQYALANNPGVQSAQYTAHSLSERQPQAKSLPDPQLLTTVFLEEIQTAAGPQELAMSLAQKFPWFGKLDLRGQVACQEAMAAYARATALELKVVEQVKRSYFDLSYVQNAISETKKLEQPLKDVIRIAKAKYEASAGRGGLESLLQTQVELAKLQTAIIEFERNRADAQAKLAGILHLPAGTRIDALPNLKQTDLAHTAKTLLGLIEDCQPELFARRHEIARDQSSIDLARREFWPDVTFGVSWYEMADRGISPVSNGQDAFSLGFGVNLPIYRKRLRAAVREAEYKKSATILKYAADRDRLQAEVEALYALFEAQDRVLKILEAELLPPADQTLQLSVESYRTGTLEFQQLIDSYRTLLSYRIDYHKRKALREQAIASLERVVGCAITGSLNGNAASDSTANPPPAPLPENASKRIEAADPTAR